MIRTIVVDDEWYSLLEVCELAQKTGFMSVEGQFQNAADALRESEFIRPQAAFIDIEMPGMDGLTLAEKLLETNPDMKIVFITGWNEYAIPAFELNALDYIMKPVNRNRFEKMAHHLQTELAVQKPSGKAVLAIRCFGRFETLENGEPVPWEWAKAEELFALLALNANTIVPKQVILESLWPNYVSPKFLPILQTSVCKIRNVLSDCVDSVRLTEEGGGYGLFLSSDVVCDYQNLWSAVLGFRAGDRRTYQQIYDACKIFEKGLLTSRNYPWTGSYETKLWRGLADCLQLIADSLPEEKRNTALSLRPLNLQQNIK